MKPGQVLLSDDHESVLSMWLEWTTGRNGNPPIRDLEAGFPANKWRSYKSGRQAMCERKVSLS
jgi:hypothetical protein